jgi:hypothetical protein
MDGPGLKAPVAGLKISVLARVVPSEPPANNTLPSGSVAAPGYSRAVPSDPVGEKLIGLSALALDGAISATHAATMIPAARTPPLTV